MKNKKEVYGFRKSKVAKTLCGAVLGTALIAFADQEFLLMKSQRRRAQVQLR